MSLEEIREGVPYVGDSNDADPFEDSGAYVVDLVTERIKELAEGTGAAVRGNVRGTTSLIAYNGAQELVASLSK